MKKLGMFINTATLTFVGATNGPTWDARGSSSVQGTNDIVSKISGFLNVTAISGVGATATIKFQYSYDNSNWVDIISGAFTASTTTGAKDINNIANNGGAASFYRYVATVGGTTPSVTFTTTLYLQE